MRKRNNGSASVGVLIIGMFLAAVAQLGIFYLTNEYEKQLDYWRGYQLRMLCASYMQSVAPREWEGGDIERVNVTLYPAAQANVSGKVQYSADGLLRYITVTADGGDDVYRLRQLKLRHSDANAELLKNFMFISGREIITAEDFTDSISFTAGEQIALPRADTFQAWGINDFPIEEIRLNGLNGRMYYIKSSNDLKFPSGMKLYGSGVVAVEGTIVIGSNCRFSERVILISQRNIIVQDGADLSDALLLAHGSISVGKGCRINGAAIAGGNVELNGNGEFSVSENAVKPFESVLYII